MATPTVDALTAWLREQPDHRSASAVSRIENYTSIQLTLSETGKPDLVGIGWDLGAAFERATTEVSA